MKELLGISRLRSIYRLSSSLSQINNNVESRQAASVICQKMQFLPENEKPREAWLENIDTPEEKKLDIVPLHPDVFGVMPRLDIIQKNVNWQKLYRFVCYANTKVRSEVAGGGRKPWPQKGTGRARHGSIRSPLFKGGGVVHGPRSPTTHFYMLPFYQRVLGLTSTVSIKLAQGDLHIVNDLEIPNEEASYIEDLINTREWGISVLFVDDTDTMARNITLATDKIKQVNLMPLYGLNVYSMLKHETLVLTLSAVRKLEERILFQLHRTDHMAMCKKFKLNQQ